MQIKTVTPIQGPMYHLETEEGAELQAFQIAVFRNSFRQIETTPYDQLEQRRSVRRVRWFLANFITGEMIPTMDPAEADRQMFDALLVSPQASTRLNPDELAMLQSLLMKFGLDEVTKTAEQLHRVRLNISAGEVEHA